MQLNKRWTCMVLLLVLLPVTAYSQMGLYELQQGKMAVGFAFTGLDFSIRQEIMGIGGNLSYGINSRTKVGLVTNIGILDEDQYGGSEIDVPPPVMIGVGLGHVGPLGRTGLDYFLTSAFYTGFSSGIARRLDDPTNETLLSVRTNGLAGGGGVSKRLKTGIGWALRPFCGLSYSRSWSRIDRKGEAKEMGRNRSSSGYAGNLGLVVEFSPAISLTGTFGISLEDFDNSFSIGLNFH